MRMADSSRKRHSQADDTTAVDTNTNTAADADTDAEPRTNDNAAQAQEAFLIRKASDYIPPTSHSRGAPSSAARFFRDLGGGSPSTTAAAGGWQSSLSSSSPGDTAPGKIVEGLGLDARRYIEGLLSLNR